MTGADNGTAAERLDGNAGNDGSGGGARSIAVADRSHAPSQVSGESAALLSMIERAARDPSVDIDRMERLFKMHEQAEARRSRSAYYSALSEMQAELPAAVRRGKGHNNKEYARFEDVVAALRDVFKRHGFSITFRVSQPQGAITVTGILGHSMGHTEQTEITLPADTSDNKNAVQAHASSVSYGKRYVTLTLTGIATEGEDDDGKAAGACATITAEQAEELTLLITETKSDIVKFLALGNLESISDMPADKFASAKQMLLAKKAKMGQRQ